MGFSQKNGFARAGGRLNLPGVLVGRTADEDAVDARMAQGLPLIHDRDAILLG